MFIIINTIIIIIIIIIVVVFNEALRLIRVQPFRVCIYK